MYSAPQIDAGTSVFSGSLGIVLILAFLVTLFVYALPLIVAATRGIENRGLHALATVLFGWTLVGWLACMLWACLAGNREQRTWRPTRPLYPGYDPPQQSYAACPAAQSDDIRPRERREPGFRRAP